MFTMRIFNKTLAIVLLILFCDPSDEQEGCLDTTVLCKNWAGIGFCDRQHAFMKEHCRRTCGFCPMEIFVPPSLGTTMTTNTSTIFVPPSLGKTMTTNSSTTTTISNITTSFTNATTSVINSNITIFEVSQKSTTNFSEHDCQDNNVQCSFWARVGECFINPHYMLENCKASCFVCSSINTTSSPEPPTSSTMTPEDYDIRDGLRKTIRNPDFQCGIFIKDDNKTKIRRTRSTHIGTIIVNNGSILKLWGNPQLKDPEEKTSNEEMSFPRLPKSEGNNYEHHAPAQSQIIFPQSEDLLEPQSQYLLSRKIPSLVHFGQTLRPQDTEESSQFDMELNVNDVTCGVSPISDRYVITAAHCVYNRSLTNGAKFRLGEIDFNTTGEENSQPMDYDIDAIILHPDYNPSSGMYNDIALLKTRQTIRFSGFVFPYCLSDFRLGDVDFSDKKLIVSGFGNTADSRSPVLQETMVQFLGTAECERRYIDSGKEIVLNHSYPHLLQERGLICVIATNSSTCHGDSGGPLILEEAKEKKGYLIGVVSTGPFCGGNQVSRLPEIYTEVAHFLDWIDSIIYGT